MTFRISPDMRDRLAAAADDRPIGEEIRRRLEASFAPSPATSEDPRFSDLLTAIGHAASVAAEMRRDGSFNPYVAFEVAVARLVEAFRPEGDPAPTRENSWQGFGVASAAAMRTLGIPRSAELMSRLVDIERREREAEGSEP
jgi:hypothetical protein